MASKLLKAVSSPQRYIHRINHTLIHNFPQHSVEKLSLLFVTFFQIKQNLRCMLCETVALLNIGQYVYQKGR